MNLIQSCYTRRMTPRHYTRPSFDSVRAEERARLRELEAVALEFKREAKWVEEHWNLGSDPETLRRDLGKSRDRFERIERSYETFRAAPLPDGARIQAALVAIGAAHLQAQAAADAGVPVERFHEPLEAVERLLGVRGPGLDGVLAARLLFDNASAAGAAGVDGLAAATRQASQLISEHHWAEGGDVWRACCRPVRLPNFRASRVWVAAPGVVQLQEAGSMAGPALAGNVDTAWPYASIVEWDPRRTARILSRMRLVNSGGPAEAAAIIASAISAWQFELDVEAAEALAGSTVASTTGTATVAHVEAAITKLDEQRISGQAIGTRRPILIVGRGKRKLARMVAPTAEGDLSALVDRVIVSPVIATDAAFIVSQEQPPLVLGGLHVTGTDVPAPTVATGEEAGPVSIGAVPSPWAIAVVLDVAPIATCEQAGAVLGAVKLV